MVANELSLVIENPNEGQFLKHIDWNKEEFMELVSSITEQYADVVYSDDQIKDAKDTRAKLNSMKKAISDRRIQVKKEVMAPYTQFEAEVTEVTKLIDDAITSTDIQIKAYEEKVKADKKKDLQEHFEGLSDGLEGILTFDMIFDMKWLNATVTLAKAKKEIEEKITKVKTDLNTIESLETEFKMYAKDVYVKTLDMSKAMAEIGRLQEMKKKEEEAKARKEEAERKAKEERIAREEAEKAATESEQSAQNTVENAAKTEESVIETAENAPEPEKVVTNSDESLSKQDEEVVPVPEGDGNAVDPFTPPADTKQYKASFTVIGTKDQIMALKQYMVDNKLNFGKVEK